MEIFYTSQQRTYFNFLYLFLNHTKLEPLSRTVNNCAFLSCISEELLKFPCYCIINRITVQVINGPWKNLTWVSHLGGNLFSGSKPEED